MTACLIATLLAGPALDAVVCRDDDVSHAVQTTSAATVAVSSSSHDGGDLAAAGLTICVHGHCHHGVAFGPSATEIAVVEAPGLARHIQLASIQHDSLSPSGLERPPRA